jgi:hypothetical protein
MKTDQLIQLLASQAGPADLHRVMRRIGLALLVGLVASVALCLATLGLNPDLRVQGPALLTKLLYVGAALAASGWWLTRAARPAAPWRGAGWALALVLGLMTGWVLFQLQAVPRAGQADFLLGQSWMSCPWRVAALALPAAAAAFWGLRGLAPTRPRLAGFAAGLSGGAAGALAYALYCNETSPGFVLLWYSAGMLLPAVAGASLGPRLLRW